VPDVALTAADSVRDMDADAAAGLLDLAEDAQRRRRRQDPEAERMLEARYRELRAALEAWGCQLGFRGYRRGLGLPVGDRPGRVSVTVACPWASIVPPAELGIAAKKLTVTVAPAGVAPNTGDFAVPPSVDRVRWYRFRPRPESRLRIDRHRRAGGQRAQSKGAFSGSDRCCQATG
jgi:hypothetical protein